MGRTTALGVVCNLLLWIIVLSLLFETSAPRKSLLRFNPQAKGPVPVYKSPPGQHP